MSTVFYCNPTTVTIPKNPSYGSKWWKERFNQYNLDTADGSRVTYDNGPNVVFGILLIKNVDKTNAELLRTFFITTTVFGRTHFKITPPAGSDIGGGDGTLLWVVLQDKNIEDIFTYHAPGIYDVQFSYRELIS